MTADDAARRRGYAARSELALREALEAFCRNRWHDARIVHEIVMGEGKVRADVAAIGLAHIAAFEVKGAYDDTTRLIHQIGMFQLCVPEVWMVVAENHCDDAKLVRHLLPSVGLLVGSGMDRDYGRKSEKPLELTVIAEAVPRAVVPEMAARILWADEVRKALTDAGSPVGAKTTRTAALKALLDLASPAELQTLICKQLRAREAMWRADPAVGAPSHAR